MRMFRSMWIPGLAIVFGLVLGTLAAGPPGGSLGSIIGLVFGLLMLTGREAVGLREGAKTHLKKERLLCIPKGQVAECSFLREDGTGRWLDVASCSLCNPAEEISCMKRCLILMNDMVGPRKTVQTDSTG